MPGDLGQGGEAEDEQEADGRIHRLVRGATPLLSGGVRHRRRTTEPGSRVPVVAIGDHVEVPGS
ncbi:hypothetical protein ACFV14_13535 [Streptomyces zaomyceticus]|uniref:hypothetical protein n=1 Tax=Streptomyces zaomyceticus TaxID=68286 RepID=UPI00368FF893